MGGVISGRPTGTRDRNEPEPMMVLISIDEGGASRFRFKSLVIVR